MSERKILLAQWEFIIEEQDNGSHTVMFNNLNWEKEWILSNAKLDIEVIKNDRILFKYWTYFWEIYEIPQKEIKERCYSEKTIQKIRETFLDFVKQEVMKSDDRLLTTEDFEDEEDNWKPMKKWYLFGHFVEKPWEYSSWRPWDAEFTVKDFYQFKTVQFANISELIYYSDKLKAEKFQVFVRAVYKTPKDIAWFDNEVIYKFLKEKIEAKFQNMCPLTNYQQKYFEFIVKNLSWNKTSVDEPSFEVDIILSQKEDFDYYNFIVNQHNIYAPKEEFIDDLNKLTEKQFFKKYGVEANVVCDFEGKIIKDYFLDLNNDVKKKFKYFCEKYFEYAIYGTTNPIREDYVWTSIALVSEMKDFDLKLLKNKFAWIYFTLTGKSIKGVDNLAVAKDKLLLKEFEEYANKYGIYEEKDWERKVITKNIIEHPWHRWINNVLWNIFFKGAINGIDKNIQERVKFVINISWLNKNHDWKTSYSWEVEDLEKLFPWFGDKLIKELENICQLVSWENWKYFEIENKANFFSIELKRNEDLKMIELLNKYAKISWDENKIEFLKANKEVLNIETIRRFAMTIQFFNWIVDEVYDIYSWTNKAFFNKDLLERVENFFYSHVGEKLLPKNPLELMKLFEDNGWIDKLFKKTHLIKKYTFSLASYRDKYWVRNEK